MHFYGMRKKMNRIIKVLPVQLLFYAMVFTATGLISCKTQGNMAARQQKAIEQRKEAQRNQSMARYQNKMSRHERMQSEEGRNRIKQAREQSKRLDKQGGQRKFFLLRWFSKKEPDCQS